MKMTSATAILRQVAIVIAACALSSCGGGSSSGSSPTPPVTPDVPPPASRILSVTPVAQETPVWCWAASAQMIFQYYGLPNLNNVGDYQCGIVAAYFGQYYPNCYYDCTQCIMSIPSLDQEQLLINGYGQLARNLGFPSRVLISTLALSPLGFPAVQQEIAAGRPVLVGISPGSVTYPDFPQHAVVVVGYDASGQTPQLVINDPFPYATYGQPNPYLMAGAQQRQPGQYVLSYALFASQLNWVSAIYGIQ